MDSLYNLTIKRDIPYRKHENWVWDSPALAETKASFIAKSGIPKFP